MASTSSHAVIRLWSSVDLLTRSPPVSRFERIEFKPRTAISSSSSSSSSSELAASDKDNNVDNPNKKGSTSVAAVANAGHPKPCSTGFGKLKAQKVKIIAKTSSLMKQQLRKDENKLEATEDLLFNRSKKQTVSNSSQTEDSLDTMMTRIGEDVKNDEYQMLDYDIVPQKPQKYEGDELKVSAIKDSGSYSRGWGNAGSVYSIKSTLANPASQRRKLYAENDFFSRKSFRDLGCSEFMIEALKRQLVVCPSHIQAMSFAPAMNGKSCIIADQSGSGKTLAYLLPVIQRLREQELQGICKSLSKSPQVIIMVPTAELASQVLNTCRSIAKSGVPFRSMVVTGGYNYRTQLENLKQGVDVLIATPGRFIFLIKEGYLELTNLKCVVLDEVDILFNDEDFEVALQSLINSSPVATQYLFVTATLPVDVYNKLIEVFPDCQVIMGPGIHRTSGRLEEVLVDCSGESGSEKTPEAAFLNKKSALLQLVEQSPVSRTIVFCNKIETCRKVENVLKRYDRKESNIKVLPFHAALAQESRLANMKEFMNAKSGQDSLFLVCTDRASRGIDFVGVDHVVLFDFPRDPSEYVRRVGRTARGAGGKGKAFIFVVGKQVSLGRKIIERNRKGHPLHDVPMVHELMN